MATPSMSDLCCAISVKKEVPSTSSHRSKPERGQHAVPRQEGRKGAPHTGLVPCIGHIFQIPAYNRPDGVLDSCRVVVFEEVVSVGNQSSGPQSWAVSLQVGQSDLFTLTSNMFTREFLPEVGPILQ